MPHGDRPVRSLTIYSRPGCHLCDEMKIVVSRIAKRLDIPLSEIDISGNESLEKLYGEEIPVLMVDGRKAAKYRISEDQLKRILEARNT